jgi:EmrB/QacA subfamily drug resistance transporter
MTRQRITLIVVSIATAMLMLDIAVVNTAMPSIARDLDAQLGDLQWIVDAYTLALATVVLTAGSIADRIGRRRVFLAGLVVFTAASAGCAAAPDVHVLDAARAIQGLGAAMLFAASLPLLTHAFPGERERAGAFAVYGATIASSFALGPLVGGALTSGISWEWAFLVNVPLGIGAYVATRRGVEESFDPRPRRVDWAGQATLTAGLFLLVLALLRANDVGWGATHTLVELGAAAAALAAFVAVERRVTDPMMPLGLFRNRRFTGAQVSVLAISASFYAVYIYLSVYLQAVVGLSAIGAGLAFLVPSLVSVVASGATAKMLERVPAWTLAAGGLALSALGQLAMLPLQVDSAWTVLLPGAFLGMIGAGIFNPSVSGEAMGSLPEHQSGLAAGVHDTFRQAGIAVGVAALGAFIPAGGVLSGGDPAGFVGGLHHALIAGAAISALGAVAAVVLLRRREDGSPPVETEVEPEVERMAVPA